VTVPERRDPNRAEQLAHYHEPVQGQDHPPVHQESVLKGQGARAREKRRIADHQCVHREDI